MLNKYHIFALVCISAVANVYTAPTSSDDANHNHEATKSERTYLDCLQSLTWFDGTNKLPIQQMDTLPGLGFDGLRHLEMGQVFEYDYSTCKTAMNGRFLIPTSILIVPLRESHYKLDAEIFHHWEKYTSLTSPHVKFGTRNSDKISGSFSKEKQTVKTNAINSNSTIVRVVFRNRLLSVSLDTSAAKLTPTFRDRVYEIAASIQNNDTCMADYLSELLVRDYGTHYISSVETGAIVAKLDYIKNQENSQQTHDSLTTTAKLTFPIFSLFTNTVGFNFDRTNTHSDDDDTSYKENIERTEIFTIGGSPLTPKLDLNTWLKDLPNKMAVIDRAANPLYYAITHSKFPQLQSTIVTDVGKYVKNSIQHYYEINTRLGCLQPGNKNFDFRANVGDDTKCAEDSPAALEVNSAFGGTYQTCKMLRSSAGDICKQLQIEQTNKKSGEYHCPAEYNHILLTSGRKAITTTKPRKTCYPGLIKEHCKVIREEHVSEAQYDAYWCAAPMQVPQSYLFGGYFTSSSNNLITGERSCPPYFQEHKIATNVVICTSSDYELASPYAVKFGGFFTCKHGNPLAANSSSFDDESKWPKSCGSGFSQHYVTSDSRCEINVCLELKPFDKAEPLPPILPPFHKRPLYIPYWSGDRLFGSGNTFLVREIDGQWESYSRDDDDIKTLAEATMQWQENSMQTVTNSDNNTTPAATESPSQSMSTSTLVYAPSGIATAALVLAIIASIFACVAITVACVIVCNCTQYEKTK